MHEGGMEDFSIYHDFSTGIINGQVTNSCTAVQDYVSVSCIEKSLLNIMKTLKTLFSLENWKKRSRKDFIYPLYTSFICKVGQMRGFQGTPCA